MILEAQFTSGATAPLDAYRRGSSVWLAVSPVLKAAHIAHDERSCRVSGIRYPSGRRFALDPLQVHQEISAREMPGG